MKSAKSLLFLLLTICTFVLSVANASAQNQSVELTPGKKVIYVDRLGLPGYVNVSELLQLFPECVARGDELYSNFDIQYDGKSVGSGRDIFLFQTKLSQIEKIEIPASSVATQQNDFFSGSINLIPGKLDEGISGDAYIDLSSEPGLVPSVDINYKKEKLQMSEHADLEAVWPRDHRTFKQTTPQYISDGEKISNGKYFQETAKLSVRYDINDKDILKGQFIESFENYNIAQTFARIIGSDKSVIFNNAVRKGDPLNWEADIDIIKSWGYRQSRSLEDGIKKYIEWAEKES